MANATIPSDVLKKFSPEIQVLRDSVFHYRIPGHLGWGIYESTSHKQLKAMISVVICTLVLTHMMFLLNVSYYYYLLFAS